MGSSALKPALEAHAKRKEEGNGDCARISWQSLVGWQMAFSLLIVVFPTY